jgi:hypothetical protein
MSQISQLLRSYYFSKDRERHLRTAGWLFLGAAVLYSLGWTIGKTQTFQNFDFGAYYRSAEGVARGGTPYTINELGATATFVYAPAYAYLLSPLSSLDYIWTCRIWMMVNWLICLACIYLSLRLVADQDYGFGEKWILVWLGTLPVASYMWDNVRAGQVGALMVALCLGWAVCQRQGRHFLGGLLLALATGLKLAPALLVPYLIIRRDWRGLAGFLAGGLVLGLVPVFWVGWQGTLHVHLDWARHCQNTQITEQTCRIENQSLLGALARLPAISDGRTCFSLENLRLLEQAYPVIVVLLVVVFYAWVFRCHRHDQGKDHIRNNLHLALLLIMMTLLQPRGWRCNYVGLILACFLLAKHVCRRLPGWQVALAPLVMVVFVCAARKGEPDGFSWLRWFHQGKDFWAALVVAGMSCWCCTANRRRSVNFGYPHNTNLSSAH